MPLDPTYPAHRLAFMLQDSKAAVLLTREQLCPHLPIAQAKLVCLDTQWERIAEYSETNIQSEANLGNLAYVIYTSGSTGQPKGVLVEHRGVVNHCLFFKERCDLQMDDRVLQFASLSFDTSVEEIFPSLISGATLVLRPPDVTDLPRFLRFVEDNGVTVLNLPTSYWNLWVSQLSSLEMPAFSLLRLVIVGSEKVFRKNFTLWKKHLGERIRWVNAYGPTEATVLATIYEPVPAHEDLGGDTVPIGRPIANTHLYVLDQHLQPVPIGVPGELFIGGAGVARGYLHRPELTAERFIPDPFSGDSKARLYKTGDLVRYLPDGNLEFLGRLDHQVKIRGFRIEPGEIEAVLIQHPAVREAVVVAHENSVGDNYLTAYLVAAQLPGPSSLELRSYLQERLMDYMVPSAFVSLDVLPLSPNGKIDRKALPPPEAKNYREEPRVYVPPRSSIERVIVGVWAEVLEVDHIGAFDDFFEWGGHSLLIIRVASRLRAIFQFELEVAALFQYTTAATLASYIEQMGRRANIDTVRIADLLLYLNTLSDEEIHTTLSDS